jgi:lipoprotein-releasing system permease protein
MYKILLPIRYLLRKRISLLAILAVCLCTFITVVVMTVLNGLVSDFKQKNHEFAGDCIVTTDSLVGFPYYDEFLKILNNQRYIQNTTPVIHTFGLLNPQWSEKGYGIEVIGISPKSYSSVTNFAKTLHFRKENPAKAFSPVYAPALPGCILGIDMKYMRNQNGKYNFPQTPSREAYTISCIPLTAKGALAKAGTTAVSSKTFYFSDVSHTQLVTPDSSFVYLPFENAQMLCGMAGSVKRATSIHIKFTGSGNIKQNTKKVSVLWQQFIHTKSETPLSNLLENVNVQTWKTYRRESISAMEKEQTMMSIMFLLVGLTAVFIVFVVFYMLVNHKKKDLGILKSIGASNGGIAAMLSIFSLIIAVIGSAAGILSAWLFLSKINSIEQWLFENWGFQLWNRSIYAIGAIPSEISMRFVLTVAGCAIIACLAGALIPIYQASKYQPIQTLQVGE